jgi:hypothetical protein
VIASVGLIGVGRTSNKTAPTTAPVRPIAAAMRDPIEYARPT